jgi:hypothetical protein
VGKNLTNSFTGYIKGKDKYGAPISLNYQGKPSFKTFPGGLISLFVTFCFQGYVLMNFIKMIDYVDWNLTSQVVMASTEQLNKQHNLGDEYYSNITMGI